MARHPGELIITQVEDVAARWCSHSQLVSTLFDALRRPLLRDLTEQRLLLHGQVCVIALQLADAETCRTEARIDNEQADEPTAEQRQYEQNEWNSGERRRVRQAARAGGSRRTCGGCGCAAPGRSRRHRGRTRRSYGLGWARLRGGRPDDAQMPPATRSAPSTGPSVGTGPSVRDSGAPRAPSNAIAATTGTATACTAGHPGTGVLTTAVLTTGVSTTRARRTGATTGATLYTSGHPGAGALTTGALTTGALTTGANPVCTRTLGVTQVDTPAGGTPPADTPAGGAPAGGTPPADTPPVTASTVTASTAASGYPRTALLS